MPFLEIRETCFGSHHHAEGLQNLLLLLGVRIVGELLRRRRGCGSPWWNMNGGRKGCQIICRISNHLDEADWVIDVGARFLAGDGGSTL